MATEHHPTGRVRSAAFDLGIDGYEDAAVVGRGGVAVVYRARQRSFNRTVAVKVLSGALLEEVARRRFDRERAAIGALSWHPNIVAVYDSGYTRAGVPYLAMEYLAKGSLADRLHHAGPLPWQIAAALGVKLAGGLESAHRIGLLHRDIKPENVLLSDFGEPKLADFGIAHVVGRPETRAARLASVLHAPPEVANGQPTTEASDVYSLASTVLTLIHGRPPFVEYGDDSLVRLIVRIGTAPLPDLTAVGVPSALQAVFETAMAKDPADRYLSALDLGRALQAEQERAGLSVTPIPLEDVDDGGGDERTAAPSERVTDARPRPTAPARPTPADRGTLVALCIGLTVIVLATAAIVLLRGNSSSPTAAPAKSVSRTTVPATTPPTAPPVTTPVALPAQPGLLNAGAYTTTAFRPQLTLHLDDGWKLKTPQLPTAVELGRASDAPDVSLNFYVVSQFIDASKAPRDATAVASAAQAVSPTSAADFLESNPRLSAAPVTPVGGRVPGSAVTFTVHDGYFYSPGQRTNECARTACVLLFRNPTTKNIVAAYQGDANHFYAFPVNGVLVLATLVGPPDQLQRILPKAEAIVTSAL